jgi:N-acetyl-anhydromuramyl-L-alanine amidase AmpD
MIGLLSLVPYTDAVVAPSPNHEPRKTGAIEGIVLHATADEGNEDGTITWLCSPKSRVSCHLLVGRSGRVTRLVGDHARAWHAGVAWWRGTNDVNSITLGIEIANRNDGEPYTDAQYRRVAKIVAHYCRQGLSLDDVVSHGAVAEDRRTDPIGWDWECFRKLVEEELQPADVFEQCWNAYDRRNSERLAVDDAVIQQGHVHSAVPLPPPLPVPTAAHATATRVHPTKPVLSSRTVWINGLTVAAAGAVMLGDAMDIAFRFGVTLPVDVPVWALVAVGALNIALRFSTKCPIGKCECEDHASRAVTRVPAHVAGNDGGSASPGWR